MVGKPPPEPPARTDIVRVKCMPCNGKGWVHVTEYETNKPIQIECKDCSGDGYNEEYLFREKTLNTSRPK